MASEDSAAVDQFESVTSEETAVVDDSTAEDTQTPGDKQGESVAGEKEEKPPEVTLDTLQSKIAELEKVNKGQYGGLKEERRKRQEFESRVSTLQGRLDQITEMLSKVKGAKTESEDIETDAKGKMTYKGIPVMFDDDGNPYLPEDKLLEFTKKGDVAAKVTKMEERDAVMSERNAILEATQRVLAKDEAFPEAYKTLTNAFTFLDQGLMKIIEQDGVDPKTVTNINTAMEIMEGSKELTSDFNKQFPGIDMDTVVEALTVTNKEINSRKLTRALNQIKSSMSKGEPETSTKKGEDKAKTLKVLANKASSLSGLRNQKVDIGPTLDDISNMSIDDFMKLSDSEVDKIKKLAAGED